MPAEQVLITTGEDEVFVDDVKLLVENIKVSQQKVFHTTVRINFGQVSGNNVEFLIGERECHNAPVCDRMLGQDDRAQMKRLCQWILNLVNE